MSDQAVDDPSLSETGGEVAIEILESDAKREESTDLPVSNGNVASEEGQDQVQADPSSSESAVVVSPVPADDSSADSNFLSEPSTVPAISLSEPSSDSISDATTALSEPIITATLSSSEPEPAEDTVSQSDDVSADAPSSSSASASASSSSSQTLIPPTPATEESEPASISSLEEPVSSAPSTIDIEMPLQDLVAVDATSLDESNQPTTSTSASASSLESSTETAAPAPNTDSVEDQSGLKSVKSETQAVTEDSEAKAESESSQTNPEPQTTEVVSSTTELEAPASVSEGDKAESETVQQVSPVDDDAAAKTDAHEQQQQQEQEQQQQQQQQVPLPVVDVKVEEAPSQPPSQPQPQEQHPSSPEPTIAVVAVQIQNSSPPQQQQSDPQPQLQQPEPQLQRAVSQSEAKTEAEPAPKTEATSEVKTKVEEPSQGAQSSDGYSNDEERLQAALVMLDRSSPRFNAVEGLRLLSAVAERGLPQAQYQLALCFNDGIGVTRDRPVSLQWLTRAADRNHVDSMLALGLELAGDVSNAVLCEQAAQYFMRCAERGNAMGQLRIAECYVYGRGLKKDPKAAVSWYRKAADKDNVEAMIGLGRLYDQGNNGVAKDPAQARVWYERALATKSNPIEPQQRATIEERLKRLDSGGAGAGCCCVIC